MFDRQLEESAPRLRFSSWDRHQSQTRVGGGAQPRPAAVARNLPPPSAQLAATGRHGPDRAALGRRQAPHGGGARFPDGYASGESVESQFLNPAQHILVFGARLYRWVLSPLKTVLFGPSA